MRAPAGILGLFVLLPLCLTVNVNVTRKIDLRSPVVRIEHDITIDEFVKQFKFAIHSSEAHHVAFVSSSVKDGKISKELPVTRLSPELYSVDLTGPVNRPTTFSVLLIQTGVIEPKPQEISQLERQFVKYVGNALFYSPYFANHVETHVILPQGELLRYTESLEPVTKHSKKLVYGPYYNVKPESHVPLNVHFENNRPFMTVTRMMRTIEISHWGNIAVEETLEIKNCGAKLRGSFSRLDFDMGHGQKSAVISFKTALPAAAKDIYYRDEIGNISTSSVVELMDTVEVKLSPRFPLMGGWKTQYTLGYNVPAHEFLYRKDSQFSLRMRFLDHIYDDQLVEELTVKIILPELVSNINFQPPFNVEELPREIVKTYLDTVGRTVLVFRAKNLVTEHIKDFTLNYEFQMVYMLREVFMLIVAFVAIFACVLVYVRLDFSIFKDEKTELRMRVQAIVDEALSIYRERLALCQAYNESISQYKLKKDASQLTADRRKLEAEHKKLNQSFSRVQGKLAELYPDGSEKLKELLALDSSYRDLIHESYQLAERLVSGKLTKQQYQASDQEVATKKSELTHRMDALVDGL